MNENHGSSAEFDPKRRFQTAEEALMSLNGWKRDMGLEGGDGKWWGESLGC